MVWDEPARIKHLLRRAAFGWHSAEWPKWEALGHERALEALLNYDDLPNPISTLPTDEFGALVAPQDTDSLKRYWLFRFCETTRPLEEVMALFWHGHFATSDYKVQNPSIEWQQNQMLRSRAMGSFRDLVGSIAVDPAMLIWLDGNNSKKGAPNENFSRELMELFTMGVGSGYTEKDVKEGARAFTGWSYDDDKSKVKFDPKRFDEGTKSYLGTTSNLDANAALDVVVRQPAVGRFLATKLFTFFVHEDPPPAEVDRLSKLYVDGQYNIRKLVKGVLTSPEFYSDKALYAKVKSPTQFAVMLVKTLDIPYKWINDMQSYTDQMGQKLFDPPNVKGWKTGQNWINTNTMTARVNFAIHATNAIRYRGLMKDRVSAGLQSLGRNPDRVFATPEDAVLGVWNWLLPTMTIPDPTYASLITAMNTGKPKQPKPDYYWRKASDLVELIVTSPEYQLA